MFIVHLEKIPKWGNERMRASHDDDDDDVYLVEFNCSYVGAV